MLPFVKIELMSLQLSQMSDYAACVSKTISFFTDFSLLRLHDLIYSSCARKTSSLERAEPLH
jgi:hypothetical protein